MKNLFLIDGASGTGKTDLLRYLNEFAIEAKTLHKFTTRERRKFAYLWSIVTVFRNIATTSKKISEKLSERRIQLLHIFGPHNKSDI